jgi:sterol 3beta-glucosyltransferase
MRVTLLAVGSLGDVLPFIALGTGLIRRRYEVRLASHATYSELAVSHGLDFAPVEGNPLDILNAKSGRAWLASTDNPLLFLARTSKIAAQVLDAMSTDAWAAGMGSDALIYSLPLAAIGYSIAEGLCIPGIPASLYPLHPTREFPSIITPRLPLAGAAVNWLSGYCVAQLFWQIIRINHDRWRREQLDLGPLPLGAPFSRYRKLGIPYLYGYSPSVVADPGDWNDGLSASGYWFLEKTGEWRPPAELIEFLRAGSLPLYVGFGSMVEADCGALTETVVDALRRARRRAVISSGWGGLSRSGLPGFVFPVDRVPHDWLFPRVAAAVHHGGVGTTAAALRAGIPSIIVPYFADQFFWGRRVSELGLGPRPVPRASLSADALARAMKTALGDAAMRGRCASMALRIAGENGVETAAGIVDGYLRSTTRRIIHRRSRPGSNGAILPSRRESQPTV